VAWTVLRQKSRVIIEAFSHFFVLCCPVSSSLALCIFFSVLEFEVRALCLWGRHPPKPCLSSSHPYYFRDTVLLFAQISPDHDPPV
jgi:hypothetical protein